jgi:catechol 2,3-dioxygenase-like lactoylglutathione lyase family enzyme
MTTPKARFGGIDVVARDMAASIAFYRELGLEIADDKLYSEDGVPHHFDTHVDGAGGFDLDSEAMTNRFDPGWSGGGVIVSFRTESRDDVDALHDHMVGLGHPSHLAPFDAFWGARYAVIVDPDGNRVSLMSPMDSAGTA